MIEFKKISSKYVKNLKQKYKIKAEAKKSADYKRITLSVNFDIEQLNKDFLKEVWITFDSLSRRQKKFLVLICLRFGDTMITLDKARTKWELDEVIFTNIVFDFLLGPRSEFYKTEIEDINNSAIVVQSWRI